MKALLLPLMLAGLIIAGLSSSSAALAPTSTIAECPFTNGYSVGYHGKQIATCIAPPTPTAGPSSGCPAVPTLVPGQEYSATFAVFCQSPWTTPISANCQTGNCTAPWSSNVITADWSGGNTCQGFCSVTANVGSGAWGNTNYYYAQSSDPLVFVSCTGPSFQCNPTGAEAPPTQIRIPAVARGPLGCTSVTTDQPMQIIQPNGDDMEFGYVGSCGSGSGGNWQTNDTLVVQAAGHCGNIAQPGLGFFQTAEVASAAGHCFLAGAIRANELAAGVIPHALYLTGICGGSPGGTTWQYPATPGAQTQNCTNGATAGPPLGGRLWWDEPASVVNGLSLSISEKAILNALHTYGGYETDDIGGGAAATGLGEIGSESGYMFFQYGVVSPFSTLSDWTGYSCPTAGSGTCYQMTSHSSSGEWNPFTPGTGGALDPLVHFHWLNPCSAQNTC